MDIKPSQISAIALILGYTIFGLISVHLIYDRKYCNSQFFTIQFYQNFRTLKINLTRRSILKSEDGILIDPPQAHFQDRYCATGFHGFFSSLSVFIIGYAVVAFRIMNGFRTRFVKLVHASLHGLALVLFGISYYFILFIDYDMLYDKYHFHKYTSMFVGSMYLLQFFIGWAFFLLQRNIQFRLTFAPFHDVVGIWLLVCLVGCLLSGKRFAQSDYTINNQLAFYGLTFVSYSFLFIVLLNPYFEWDLVGHM